MEIERIQELAREWNSATWKVIEFKNPGFKEISRLFRETHQIIEEYSKEKFVPKEICSLLLEMQDFEWWVCDLEDTPLHVYYQEILAIVIGLNKYFLTRDANIEGIKDTIDRIGK